MSKRNMLLGLAAGKVGDLVFYRDGGEQRTRTRVIPKNPRSSRQMEQRVKIANVSAFYRAFANVLSDSFPNRPSHRSGYNEFSRAAISISPYLTKEMVSAGVCVASPYQVAKGNIASLPFQLVNEREGAGVTLAVAGLAAEDTSVGAVSAALLAAYPQLQNGDKLVSLIGDFVQLTGTDNVYFKAVQPTVAVFEIDTTSDSSILDSHISVSEGLLSFTVVSTVGWVSGALFASRVDGNGRLDVSSASMVLEGDTLSTYETLRSESAMLDAIESYGVGEQKILREWD